MSDNLQTIKDEAKLEMHVKDLEEDFIRRLTEIKEAIKANAENEQANEKVIGEVMSTVVKEDLQWLHDFKGGWKFSEPIIRMVEVTIGITIAQLLTHWSWVLKLFGWH